MDWAIITEALLMYSKDKLNSVEKCTRARAMYDKLWSAMTDVCIEEESNE